MTDKDIKDINDSANKSINESLSLLKESASLLLIIGLILIVSSTAFFFLKDIGVRAIKKTTKFIIEIKK